LRRRKTRTRRLELGAACAAVLYLSACGGGQRHAAPPPRLPRPVAQTLAARADAVAAALAAGNSCQAATLAGRLQQDTLSAINNGRIAAALQEPLSGAVNDLVGRVVCVRPPSPPAQKEHGRGKHKGHHKKHEEGD
jgi:hypothetical protein